MSKRDFTVIKKIGSGSFSNVFKVKRIEDDCTYAMKEINFSSLKSADKEGALNEIRLLASIKSQYVVQYYDAFLDEKSKMLCIIMDYAEKGDLAGVIKQYQQKKIEMPEEEIWNVIKCVSKGLRDLHKMKIMHRDIKCANLFVASDKTIKIGDLNVSKLQKMGYARTQTGTPYYCPPEIWGDRPYDSKCDIWSFGVVVYEMCTGKPPFNANSMNALYDKIKKGKYAPIPSNYSKELNNLLSKMLKVNPSQRVSTQEIIDQHIVDYSKTLVRRNSDPNMLATIKVPRDMLRLKAMLPEKRYKNAKPTSDLMPDLNTPKVTPNLNSNRPGRVEIKQPQDINISRFKANQPNPQPSSYARPASKLSSRPDSASSNANKNDHVRASHDSEQKILSDLINKQKAYDLKMKHEREAEEYKKWARLKELQKDRDNDKERMEREKERKLKERRESEREKVVLVREKYSEKDILKEINNKYLGDKYKPREVVGAKEINKYFGKAQSPGIVSKPIYRPDSKASENRSGSPSVHDRLYKNQKRPSSRASEESKDSKLYGILYANKYDINGRHLGKSPSVPSNLEYYDKKLKEMKKKIGSPQQLNILASRYK